MVETSQQAEGLTHRVVLNMLEAFFRRPLLHLVPLVLLVGLGILTAFGAARDYEASGTLDATTDSLLAELTDRPDINSFAFETPGDVTARNINQLLGSRTFLLDIVEGAGLTTAVRDGLLTLDDIKGSISASAEGDNFVSITATTDDPARSKALADASLDSFKNWVIDGEVRRSETARDSLQREATSARAELETARQAEVTYATQNPVAKEEDRPLVQRIRLRGLEDDVDRANGAYDDALQSYRTAQAAVEQTRSVVDSQLSVIDEPELPEAAMPRLQKAVLTVALFCVLGVMLSLALVVLSSMLDRTIRVPDDITARYGLEVLAVVPRARG